MILYFDFSTRSRKELRRHYRHRQSTPRSSSSLVHAWITLEWMASAPSSTADTAVIAF